VTWSPSGPERFRLYDGGAPAPAVADAHGLSSLSTPSEGAAAAVKLLSPDNPLFVLFAIGAVTLGFAAFSTSGSVRVGKTKVSGALGVGKT
jgi:hypothetical protein